MAVSLPLFLVILDGWGHSDRTDGNAIVHCEPRFINSLRSSYPHGLLKAAGESVGLPPGYIGNSEVGHLCLGAGRVVAQDLMRINRAMEGGGFERNEILTNAVDRAAPEGTALHLMGLFSDGGVHSHIDHFDAMVDLARKRRVRHLFVHAFLDGRDTPPTSGLQYVRRAEQKMREAGLGAIATVSGRYYSMDRDNRWDRTQLAYRALVLREGVQRATATEAVQASYDGDVGDEFMIPAVIETHDRRTAAIRDGDVAIFFNFRADRARELTRALTDKGFDRFERGTWPQLATFVCFTRYDHRLTLPVAFPPQRIKGTLAEALSRAGIPQLRIAETEKYAHVTYFFNGGVEQPVAGEERCLIPSSKVATYDLEPEMRAREVTDEVLRRIAERPQRVVILNYANADMVGHTGFFDPTVTACRVVDQSVERVVTDVLRRGGTAIVTSDHGNAEEMIDPETGGRITAHSTNPVPVHLVGPGLKGRRVRDGGKLGDVAPTMLEMLGIPIPDEMEGRSLLEK